MLFMIHHASIMSTLACFAILNADRMVRWSYVMYDGYAVGDKLPQQHQVPSGSATDRASGRATQQQVSDAEAVHHALFDKRWQMVLDCLDCEDAPFSQGLLAQFRFPVDRA